jgi:heme-degrading monooxygenase HmoA
MILEVAVLDVKPGQEIEFQQAFTQAQTIIARSNGYQSHQLQKCMEKNSRYLLLVNWDTLEDHMEGFRGSEEYQEWRSLLHHFYDPFPEVEHYTTVYHNSVGNNDQAALMPYQLIAILADPDNQV